MDEQVIETATGLGYVEIVEGTGAQRRGVYPTPDIDPLAFEAVASAHGVSAANPPVDPSRVRSHDRGRRLSVRRCGRAARWRAHRRRASEWPALHGNSPRRGGA